MTDRSRIKEQYETNDTLDAHAWLMSRGISDVYAVNIIARAMVRGNCLAAGPDYSFDVTHNQEGFTIISR